MPGVEQLGVRERAQLASIATVIRHAPHTDVYLQGDPAEAVYNLVEGAACSYRLRRAGARRVLCFLFAGDLFGLARNGVYVNSVRTITPVTMYRFPLGSLRGMLLRNAKLQFHFLCKAGHALRETQRQIMMLSRRNPVDRLATMLAVLEDAQPESSRGHVSVPMTVQEAGEWLDMSPRTVVQALDRLEGDGIVSFDGAHGVTILHRQKFQAIVGGG